MDPLHCSCGQDFYHITSPAVTQLSSTLLHPHSITSSQMILQVSPQYTLCFQLKINDQDLFLDGTLLHCNGGVVFIEGRYREAFFHKSESSLGDRGDLVVRLENGVISWKGWFKFHKTELMINDNIQAIVKQVQNSLRKVLEAMEACGIRKGFTSYSKTLKKASLNLRRKVFQILSNFEALKKNTNTLSIQNSSVMQKPAIIFVKQITQHKAVTEELPPIRKGGYFQIEKKILKITIDSTKQEEKECVIKRIKKINRNSAICTEKIRREWKIIENIVSSEHCLNYYSQKSKSQENKSMIMDYVKLTLGKLFEKKTISIKTILNFFNQMIDSVEVLHLSNVIHRDLKPQNFLVSDVNNQYKLKVIDFGEAVLTSEKFNQKQSHNLGCTMPYSPIQCTIMSEEGFNKKQIDFWSLGIIFYEIIFQRLPVSYSRCYARDIAIEWRSQFCVFSNIRKKRGLKQIQEMIGWISEFTLNISQKKRLTLPIMRLLVQKLMKFQQRI